MVAVVDLAASERVLQLLEQAVAASPKAARRAAKSALVSSMKSGKSAASQEIRREINLPKAKIDSRISTKIVSEKYLVGSLRARDRRFELVDFMTQAQIASAWRRQNQRKRRSKGVYAKPLKKKGRILFEGAFVNVGKSSGRWHVLKRESTARYPALIQYGPRLLQYFEKGFPAFAERQNEVLNRRMADRLNAVLKGFIK